ncbi:MAG: ABC transporter permease [Acidimicrobiia bacterium]|nr:ABC transporter permease [Acidimicrobiia bacterium]
MTDQLDRSNVAPGTDGPGATSSVGSSFGRYAARQLLRRFGQLVVLVVSISTLLFFLLRVTGDPALVLLGDLSTEEDLERVRSFYGLDQPLIVQYVLFVFQAIRLNFGRSLVSFEDALSMVLEKMPATIQLALAAVVLNLVVAILVGGWLGYRPERPERRAGLFAVLVSQGVPGFVIGLILIQIFAVELRLLPSIGREGLSSFILPAITLASFLLPRVIRLTAANVDDAMREDYVRTARASGATSTTVLFRHVMPNAVVGTIALVGVQFGFLLSGSLITETLFAWPGVGLQLIEAVRALDFPVVQATVAVVAVLVFAVQALVDILIPLADPRLRSQRA